MTLAHSLKDFKWENSLPEEKKYAQIHQDTKQAQKETTTDTYSLL